jgi:hypothetical protein
MREVKEQEETIRKEQSFTFFSNTAYNEEGDLVEMGWVEGVGKLTGKATTRDAKPGKWAIIFTIEVPPPTPEVKVGQLPAEFAPSGEPGENLVMYATLPNGEIYGSYRTIEDEKSRRLLIFNNWHKMKNTKSKIDVREKGKGSSLTVDGADVMFIHFEFK